MSKYAYLLLVAFALGATQARADGARSIMDFVGDCCGNKHSHKKKKCVPIEDVKKKTHISYHCKCEDKCLPKCHFCGLGKGKCDSCGDGKCTHCGKPRTVRKLYKRIETEDVCTTKCVVVEEDCCPTAPTFYTPAVSEQPHPITSAPSELIPTIPGTTPEVLPKPPMQVTPMKK